MCQKVDLSLELKILVLDHIITLKAIIEFYIFQFSTWFFSSQINFIQYSGIDVLFGSIWMSKVVRQGVKPKF